MWTRERRSRRFSGKATPERALCPVQPRSQPRRPSRACCSDRRLAPGDLIPNRRNLDVVLLFAPSLPTISGRAWLGGKIMHVLEHDSLEALQEHIRFTPRARDWRRVQAVLLARQGGTAQAIADSLGCRLRAVQRWVAAYNAGGLAALA